MAIKFQSGGENTLVVSVAAAIAGAKVDYDNYVTIQANTLPDDNGCGLTSDSVEQLYRICGERGWKGFIHHRINGILKSKYSFDSKTKGIPLISYKEFSDAVSSAKSIVEYLKTIPRSYRLTVQLPAEISTPLISYVSAVKIGKHLHICKPDKLPDDFPMSSPYKTDSSLFSDPFSEENNTDRSIVADRLYLTSQQSGFASITASPILANNLMDHLRAMYGALHALSFFNNDHTFNLEKRPFIIVHEEIDGKREIVETIDLSSDLWKNNYTRSVSSFIKNSDDPPKSIRTIFEKVGFIFNSDEFSRRIYTASLWYYRAKLNNNPLDRLLQATISMEVLLGDKESSDGVGIIKLLGNRCAYLLGTSKQSREEIVDQFSNIYKVRSAIVHGGKHKLDRKDREAAEQCMSLCARVIARELDLHHSTDLNAEI